VRHQRGRESEQRSTEGVHGDDATFHPWSIGVGHAREERNRRASFFASKRPRTSSPFE
jgi:hypothetical protein